MPDSAFSNAIIDNTVSNANSNVFNIQKIKNKSKKEPTIELVDSETHKNNFKTENKNLNVKKNNQYNQYNQHNQQQQQQFRSKKNVIEELNNNKQHLVATEPIETYPNTEEEEGEEEEATADDEEEEKYTEETEMSQKQGSSNMANKLVLRTTIFD